LGYTQDWYFGGPSPFYHGIAFELSEQESAWLAFDGGVSGNLR